MVAGHRSDWEFFAAESGNASWGYQSLLDDVYRRIEGWHGAPDPLFRGELRGAGIPVIRHLPGMGRHRV